MFTDRQGASNSVIPLAASTGSERRVHEANVARLRGEFMAQGYTEDELRSIERCLRGMHIRERARLHRILWTADLEAHAVELGLGRYAKVFETDLLDDHIGFTADFATFLLDITFAPLSSERRISIEPKPSFPGGGGPGTTKISLDLDINNQVCSVTTLRSPSQSASDGGDAKVSIAATTTIVVVTLTGGIGKSALADAYVHDLVNSGDAMSDLFISYSRSDRLALIDDRMLLAQLLSRGHDVWFDVEVPERGQVDAVVADADYAMVLLSGFTEGEDAAVVPLANAARCVCTGVFGPRSEVTLALSTSASASSRVARDLPPDRPLASRCPSIQRLVIDLQLTFADDGKEEHGAATSTLVIGWARHRLLAAALGIMISGDRTIWTPGLGRSGIGEGDDDEGQIACVLRERAGAVVAGSPGSEVIMSWRPMPVPSNNLSARTATWPAIAVSFTLVQRGGYRWH